MYYNAVLHKGMLNMSLKMNIYLPVIVNLIMSIGFIEVFVACNYYIDLLIDQMTLIIYSVCRKC